MKEHSSLHILGSGSIGLLFASFIRRRFPHKEVKLLLRPHHRHRILSEQTGNNSKSVICFIQSLQKQQVKPYRQGSAIRIKAELIGESREKIKNVLLCTKAPDSLSAVSSIFHRLEPRSKIIVLSNGALAIRDELQNSFKDAQIVLASTTHGAFRAGRSAPQDDQSSFLIVHAGVGETYVEDHEFCELFKTSNLNGRYVCNSRMSVLLWKKLAANCVINCMTSLHNVTNGELSPSQPLGGQIHVQSTIQRIIEEVSAVAMVENPDCAEELTFIQLNDFVHDVIQRTSKNKSSMLQDILSRREQTEIDYLNGYIVDLAKKHGILTPQNEKMCLKIYSLVQSYKQTRNPSI